MKRILITGGCGFIGSNLVAHLLESGGYAVSVLDNEVLGKREHIESDEIDFVRGDVRDLKTVERAVAGKDVVVHLAADTRVMDSIADPRFNFENNVQGTFNVLWAMKRAGVARLVNASTGGAILGEVPPPVHEGMLPEPQSPYGASKLAAEGYCSAFSGSYGMRTLSLRFSNVYGPRSFHKGSVVAAFCKRILEEKPLIVYGDGSQVRDYVFTGDLCAGIRAAIESDYNGVLQLGTGVGTDLNLLIEILKKTVGRPVEVEYQDFRAGELRKTFCDISRARKVIGYDPRTTLEDGIRRTWEWFVSRQEEST
jgi:UDP-glucose 4-epimerase